MSRVYQLAPSILSADFNRLGEQIQRVEKAECRWLHIEMCIRDSGYAIEPGTRLGE